jgi:protein-S-isoprenylcysteine O-methyltransferase Ste14
MNENLDEIKKTEYKSGMIHFVLTHSYGVVLFCLILGVIFDIFLNIKIFSTPEYSYLGFILMVIGSIVVYSTQKSSSISKKESLSNKENNFNFSNGLYKYIKHPTYLGVTILTIGFALVINSPMSVFLSIIAYFIIRFIFAKKEEKLLELKFGQYYLNYKNKNKI